MDRTEVFQAERPRLVKVASRVLGEHAEAEDVVQQAWLRLQRTDADIESLPAWLTTVTTRLCLDRLRARTPAPAEEREILGALESGADPSVDPSVDAADDLALAETVGLALNVVLDRLTPRERVAFVLHDSFGVEFATIAAILDTSPAAARKLASRARTRLATPSVPEEGLTDWEVVDAFMAAARAGDFTRLISLLAPDAIVTADDAAKLAGTPERIEGRQEVATFFDGSAHAALAAYVGDRPAAAWYHQGEARVLFDFTIAGGVVTGIVFRADPEVLARVVRRDGSARRSH